MTRLINVFRRKRPTAAQEIPVDQEVEGALRNIRQSMRDFAMLKRAAEVAADESDTGTGILEFAEDYGIDQVDPIKKIDVLRYALKRIKEARG
jgi:predicted DNA-binding protein (UPF0278 family)